MKNKSLDVIMKPSKTTKKQIKESGKLIPSNFEHLSGFSSAYEAIDFWQEKPP
jgi:hypothetical protein